ncbi:MAG: hypothetical protein HUJ63_09920, partial [Enterococcus sp.]|nr:hypothetical protein [Enterococcus sp.]
MDQTKHLLINFIRGVLNNSPVDIQLGLPTQAAQDIQRGQEVKPEQEARHGQEAGFGREASAGTGWADLIDFAGQQRLVNFLYYAVHNGLSAAP